MGVLGILFIEFIEPRGDELDAHKTPSEWALRILVEGAPPPFVFGDTIKGAIRRGHSTDEIE